MSDNEGKTAPGATPAAADPAALARALSPHESAVLRALAAMPDGAASAGGVAEAALAGASGLSEPQARSATEWLKAKGLVEVAREETLATVRLTELGEEQARGGTPEDRLLRALESQGAMSVADLRERSGVDAKDAGSAFGTLKSEGLVEVGADGLVRPRAGADRSRLDAARALLARLAQAGDGGVSRDALSPAERAEVDRAARKRGKEKGVFRVDERARRAFRVTAQGGDVARALAAGPGPEVGQLTPDMLKDGSWRKVSFRRYSLSLRPARITLGRRHPYRSFLDGVKRKLASLGFQEMTGSLVETEFWDMDALFMPQFHPARAIHDVYMVDQPAHAREIEQPFLERTARAHEDGAGCASRGWGYAFDRERTRRLVLRSQGTALSAHTLAGKPLVPGKYFGIARCFRYDTVDATHAPDFFQVEGIVLGERINLRHLLGLLRLFALEVARSDEVKFQPAYFPFTEPSVEVHMRHPQIGWMELGGAGIFRPEVTLPLGVEVPVIAWGLGLDRMAMVALGVDDIRDLFSPDLDLIRAKRILC